MALRISSWTFRNPEGESVNDGLPKEEFSVQYTHFNAATDHVFNQGQGCFLSKIDIKHAFRLLPVPPTQWILLGIFWLGHFFVDIRLPFDLRSSLAIFNCFADAICWILRHIYHLLHVVHYSHDFLLASSNYLPVEETDLTVTKKAFHHLGIPIAEEKLVGP